ncbi:MAG: hypothetical protein M3Y87_11920 [Myxococcota bacterium]|nr:hypothetical protein [Myxococcota bacterium]
MDRDPELVAELDRLSPSERQMAEEELALRARAAGIAADLALDPRDVYHVLRCIQRTPSERLRRGLAHGRIGRRMAL